MGQSLNRLVLRTYARQFLRYKGMTIAVLVFAIVSEAILFIIPFLSREFMNLLAIPGRSFAMFLPVAPLLIGVPIAEHLLDRAHKHVANRLQPRVMNAIDAETFAYTLAHSYGFFTNTFAGGLARKTQRFTRACMRMMDEIEWNIIPALISVCGVTVLMFLLNVWLGLCLIVWIIVFFSANLLFSRWKMRTDSARATADTAVGAVVVDAYTNAIAVKECTGEDFELSRLWSVNRQWAKLEQRSWDLHNISELVQGLLNATINAVLILGGIWFYLKGEFTVGDFAYIQSTMLLLFGKIWDFGRHVQSIHVAMADAREMAEVLAAPHVVVDAADARPLVVVEGAVAFDGVSFGYRAGHDVVHGLALRIAPREKVALVGPSGAGKSTIVKLLERFYDVQRGAITIDGQNIAAVTQQSLREQIAVVPQDPALFHRSIMENIRYGRRDATDAEVREAARQAHCEEFITRLPKGYDTLVGERGVKLSGGERQRVAIARAILKNAPLLILDEATASLDSESEAMIQTALKLLMREKTVIVIAHRLSTIMQMDRIVVIEHGRVADSGTHAELLKRVGTYKKLWNIQAGGFLP